MAAPRSPALVQSASRARCDATAAFPSAAAAPPTAAPSRAPTSILPSVSPITRQYVSTLEAQLEDAKKKIAELQSNTSKPVSDKPAAAPNAALLRRHTQPYMQNRSLTGEDTAHSCGIAPVRPPLPSKKRSRSYADGLDDDIAEDDTGPFT